MIVNINTKKIYVLITIIAFLVGCQSPKYFPYHRLENYEEKLTIFTHESFGLLIYKYKIDNSSVKFEYDRDENPTKMWFQIKDKTFYPTIKNGSVHFLCEEGEMISVNDYEFNTEKNTQIWNSYKHNGSEIRGIFPVRKTLEELYGDKFLEMLDSQCN